MRLRIDHYLERRPAPYICWWFAVKGQQMQASKPPA